MDRRAARAYVQFLVVVGATAMAATGCRSDGIISNGQGPGAGGAGGGGAVTGGNTGTNNPPPPVGAPNPVGTAPPKPAAGITDQEMPADVLAILQGRCAGCHTYGQADPAGWGSVLDVSRMISADIVVPGEPNQSRLIDRVAVSGDMPPQGDRLKVEEIETLKKWITNMKRPANSPKSDTDVLDAIAVDQLRLRDRSSDYRYVSFAHYAGEGRSQKEMETVKQVFVFILNSLSRKGAIVDVETIDDQDSIYRLRLSDLGWNEALWDTLTSFYPYCLRSDAVAHEGLYAQLRTEAPVVRGDWFLATATKAPLYDQLIDLPNTLDELAARLGVNINDDINHPGLAEPDNLVRIGFRRSGVALHNRMIERHLGNQGQYLWVSYDFDSSQGRADVMANPLGPANRDEQNFVHTFEHAGGEIIYTMPNGLQGYMLVNAAGDKLSEAPINIVRDPRRRNGVVENGISCYGCHGSGGMIRPRETDEVARYVDTHIAGFEGRELNEIESSYPRVLRPDIFNIDSNRYRAIADTVLGGGPPKGQSEYTAFVAMVGQYESNVGFHGAAAEFHEEYNSLRERVLANDFANIALPRTATAPLVLRDDFVCVYRDLVTKIRPNAVFCDKTFDAVQVQDDCAGTRSNNTGNNTSSGTGGSSGSSNRGGSSGSRGGSGGSSAGTGGTGGSAARGGTGGTGGSTADGGTADSGGQNCRRINGRVVCQ
jgi:mono/diheme cytochrome c family protein